MEREREQKGEKHIKLTQHPLLESSNNYQSVLDPKNANAWSCTDTLANCNKVEHDKI